MLLKVRSILIFNAQNYCNSVRASAPVCPLVIGLLFSSCVQSKNIIEF